MIFPKETVQLLFWFDQDLHVDNARLNLAYTSWWWQYSCSEECIPDSITRLGWDVNTRSIQEDKIWVW